MGLRTYDRRVLHCREGILGGWGGDTWYVEFCGRFTGRYTGKSPGRLIVVVVFDFEGGRIVEYRIWYNV